jgi:hypothetical protein
MPTEPTKQWATLYAPLNSDNLLMELEITNIAVFIYITNDGMLSVMMESNPSIRCHT